MKKTLTIAAALALAACASVDKPASSTVAQATPASGKALYCWKEKLDAKGDTLTCNWENNVNDACRSYNNSPLSKAQIASGPTDVRRCDNGQWLVMVTTR
jgi:hypothetical protein